jgi:hypothetical protein
MDKRLKLLRIGSIIDSDLRDGEIEVGKEVRRIGGHGRFNVEC